MMKSPNLKIQASFRILFIESGLSGKIKRGDFNLIFIYVFVSYSNESYTDFATLSNPYSYISLASAFISSLSSPIKSVIFII